MQTSLPTVADAVLLSCTRHAGRGSPPPGATAGAARAGGAGPAPARALHPQREPLPRWRREEASPAPHDGYTKGEPRLLPLVGMFARGDGEKPSLGTTRPSLARAGRHVSKIQLPCLVTGSSRASRPLSRHTQNKQSLLTGREVRDAQRRRPLCLEGSSSCVARYPPKQVRSGSTTRERSWPTGQCGCDSGVPRE